MSKPFKINSDGAPAAGTPKLPNTAKPLPPIQEVFDEAVKTGKGLDGVAQEMAEKSEPRCLLWGPDKQGPKPFKV